MENWYDTISDDVWGGKKTTSTGLGSVVDTKPKTDYETGIESVKGLAAGTSPIYASAENRAVQGFGGAAMAAMGTSKQNASQSGYTPEAIGSVAQTTAKNLEGERSKMRSDIATQKQALAVPAASQLASFGLQKEAQDFSQGLAKAQLGLQEKQYTDTKAQNDWERMLQTYDPNTVEGLKSLQTGYTTLFGGTAPDLNMIKQQQDYLTKKQQQEITTGGLGIQSAEQTLKDQQQASVMSRVASGYSVDRINSELGTNLTQEEYDSMRTNTDTYFKSKGIDMQEATLYGYTDDSGNHVQGSLEIAAGQFGLQGKTLDMQEKELWGYTDAEGTYHQGKYDLMSAEDKRAADAAYGYDTTVNGETVHIKGTLELANDADAIQRQGLSLQEAQVKGYVDPTTGEWIKGSVQIAAEKAGQEVSSLYGYYYDPDTGEVITDTNEIAARGNELEHVDGALALSAKQYGLSEKTYDMQYDELYGYTDNVGNQVQGKFQLLNAEDQRAASQLYGYTDDNGNHVAGSLEIAADEAEIKRQGLDLEEAQLFGYEKTDENGNPIHIYGTLEIASEQLETVKSEAEAQRNSEAGTALASYFGSMKNVTGWNYETDAQAKKLLQTYWESTGNTGAYDTQWAKNQFAATTISQTDAALANIEKEQWYKDLDPKMQEQVKTVAGVAAMLSVTQGAIPVYDTTGNITGLNDSQGNTIWQMPTETTTTTENTGERGTPGFKFGSTTEENTAWNTLQKEAEAYGITVDKLEWERSGYPTIDAYKSGVSGLNALKIENPSELLTSENSKKLFDVYTNNPEALRQSEYYYKLPDAGYIDDNISEKTSTSGVRTTTVSNEFKSILDYAIGKFVELPSDKGNVVGQLSGVMVSPTTVQLKIKKSDGTYQNYVLYSWS